MLKTGEQLLRNVRPIYLQAGRSRAMPPNPVAAEDGERRLVAAWHEGG